MDYQEWSELGNDIRRMVEDAVNAGDFRRLDENIRRTVTEGLENLGNSLKKGMESMADGQPIRERDDARTKSCRDGREPGPENACSHRGASGRPPAGRSGALFSQRAGRRPGSLWRQDPLYAGTFGVQAGGVALVAVGGTVAAGSLLTLLILLFFHLAGMGGAAMAVSAGVLAVLLVPAAAAVLTGRSFLGRTKRFRRYVEALNGRTYCEIGELAGRLGKSQRYVKNDLRKMIRSRWFKQGHLDRQETCLIVSEETYGQYLESERQLQLRRQEEQERMRRKQEENAGLSDKVRQMMETGRAYIEKIERSNDAIPGEEISNKISHMQTIVERIFERVKEDPDCADELRRFMDYYLPTTVKLLDAYEELDRQPVQGENIRNGKQEIEKTLDTLNLAFEKLLDSLFEETAWDVATDISVLRTMLAQEGLTEQKLKAEK